MAPGVPDDPVPGGSASALAASEIRSLAPGESKLHATIGMSLARAFYEEPHWYRMAIGVDPKRQGQGIGRAPTSCGRSRVEGSGLTAYLETFRERRA